MTLGADLRGSRAQAVLGRPALAPLLDELARRFGDGGEPARVALTDLDDATRTALADLLGLDRLPRNGFRLPVARLVAVLDLSSTTELREAVVAVRGPLGDRRADRIAEAGRRSAVWDWLAEQAAELDLGAGPGRLDAWVDAVRSAGMRGGVAAHHARLQNALRVLHRLPAGEVALAAFAADAIGDPHGLDHGTAVAGLVLAAVAVGLGQERPAGAEEARSLWETVGVVPDPLSSTVLVLGLPGGSADPLQQWLSGAGSAGEPVVITLATLRRWPVPALPVTTPVYVVENPSMLAEAARQGWDGPPLICSSGRPTVATVTLLRQLAAAGAPARQHADFDVAGVSITEWLRRQAGTTPWRMTGDDYLRAPPSNRPLTGPVPPTPWDPALTVVMAERGRAVYEEQLRSDLLDDVRRGR